MCGPDVHLCFFSPRFIPSFRSLTVSRQNLLTSSTTHPSPLPGRTIDLPASKRTVFFFAIVHTPVPHHVHLPTHTAWRTIMRSGSLQEISHTSSRRRSRSFRQRDSDPTRAKTARVFGEMRFSFCGRNVQRRVLAGRALTEHPSERVFAASFLAKRVLSFLGYSIAVHSILGCFLVYSSPDIPQPFPPNACPLSGQALDCSPAA